MFPGPIAIAEADPELHMVSALARIILDAAPRTGES
jgi:hypothetical protein